MADSKMHDPWLMMPRTICHQQCRVRSIDDNALYDNYNHDDDASSDPMRPAYHIIVFLSYFVVDCCVNPGKYDP